MLILFIFSALYWLAQASMAWRAARSLRIVASLPRVERANWPTISLVIPSRDEGAEVRAALDARLKEGYPALEVVLVDDRSTDDTGAQARALAAVDPRVKVIRIDVLPGGWLGKVNALQQGLTVAKGEWILFSDADVHIAPGTLARIVGWAEAEGIDHVSALPGLLPSGPLTALSLAAFFRFVVTAPRLWAVEDPKSTAAAGVGAFSLFRRRVLDRTPGLEWIKMEIGDDQALGVMLKRAGGAAQRVVVAREAVSVQFYPSFRALERALEKNGATAPMPLMVLGLLAMTALEIGWLGAFAVAWPLGVAAWSLAAAMGVVLARWLGHPVWPAFFPGLGFVPLAAVLIRSSVLAWRRGGVVWRGSFYPTATVRAGRRLL
jgi:cellulose synthase/poly-beta-1,6-N-acetylglucosamine synthase-like glycosyltransferase